MKSSWEIGGESILLYVSLEYLYEVVSAPPKHLFTRASYQVVRLS